MEIVLVRHAQPDWYSAEGQTHHQNPPLTALGLQQAELVGEHLAAEKWDRILGISPASMPPDRSTTVETAR
jgi:broad specificity phosphatase PhoE